MRLFNLNVFFGLCVCSAVFSDFHLQQTIVFSVDAINQMGQITGPAPVFALQGCGCNSASCINTYSVSTNETNKKISGSLDADMPQGTSLSVNLSPPSGARSMGTQVLSATPVDLVVELSMVSETGLPMVYTFSATAQGGVVSTRSRVVTYTLTDG